MSTMQTVIPWVPNDTLCHGVLGSVPKCYSICIGHLWPFLLGFFPPLFFLIKGSHEKIPQFKLEVSHRGHEEFNSGAKGLWPGSGM